MPMCSDDELAGELGEKAAKLCAGCVMRDAPRRVVAPPPTHRYGKKGGWSKQPTSRAPSKRATCNEKEGAPVQQKRVEMAVAKEAAAVREKRTDLVRGRERGGEGKGKGVIP